MYPPELKYHSEHTWVRWEEDSRYRIGLTFYAQEQLREIVFVELPPPGSELTQSGYLAVVESRKVAQDITCPVNGRVIDINQRLELEPGLINSDPYGEGWMVIIEDVEASQIDSLMDSEQYMSSIGGD